MGKYVAPVDDILILAAVVSLSAGPVHFLQRGGQPVPAPVAVPLLIDTGAKRTTLIPGIIRHLDRPGGFDVQVVTPLATVAATLYWVRIEFPKAGLAPFEHVQVARLPMPPGLAQFHGLLGRDLLRRFESFDYQGRLGRYTLRDAPGPLGWLRRRL
jgi:hypothetical protein